ncbi:MAG: hypothetical protein A3J47_02750 [Candidatus Yanofskybacteria bacterium RIFCSPHIGHO2_02_FULL_43_22]|uniref:Glycosyltransferase subfamily 4-like N-terminal domain-containing protein n=1 Tax=Candidatus Yanofskybacteria bacterium RIFCSPHIGHO2_02_FULL_43_22 TaxID=1802681 RepID=A0A1F8FQQ9_9BACT|nr:MAG: hypothetical protein A3J47_02750 [Candidatus Yanofskybacteria bacterium RIFCSPHIGHO2_02_FULL_43_22]
MKKILITTGIFPPDIGGPATYAEIIAKALSAEGFNVCVLTYSKQLGAKILNSDYKFKVIRVWGKWPKGLKHLIFGIKLLYLVPKFDLIYALNVWSAGFPSLIAAKLFNKKFVIRIVGDYAWEVGAGKGGVSVLIDDFQKVQKSGWTEVLYKLQGRICKKADIIIVPSKYLWNIVKGWGVPEPKLKIIYNGVDFKPSSLTKEESRNNIGVHGNIILSIGRLVPWKGFRMLIKITPRLLELKQFARLVIVGDGPDKKSLESMVKNMGLENKVFLVGRKSQEELAVYLAAADVFVLNSGYEGFSHQILEAMTVGVPVIASAVGGNKEIITQGDNGFLVKYNDEFNLIEAIKTIWQNQEFREGLIKSGKETVARFSSDKMIEETIKILIND